MLHDFKIRPKEEADGFYDIMIDGKQIEGVTNVDITMGVDLVPMIKMTVLASTVDAELRNSAVETKIQGDRFYNPEKCSGLGYEACEKCDMICPSR